MCEVAPKIYMPNKKSTCKWCLMSTGVHSLQAVHTVPEHSTLSYLTGSVSEAECHAFVDFDFVLISGQSRKNVSSGVFVFHF